MFRFHLLVLVLVPALAVDNGVGLTPAMGYNTWCVGHTAVASLLPEGACARVVTALRCFVNNVGAGTTSGAAASPPRT